MPIKVLPYKMRRKRKGPLKLITINKELEQSIQLNSPKRTFVSILAHDLKSQLVFLYRLFRFSTGKSS